MLKKSFCTCLPCSGPCSWQSSPCFALSGRMSDFLNRNMFLASRDVTWRVNHTVDGRNPAPPLIYETLGKMGYLPYQRVPDFLHQQYHDFIYDYIIINSLVYIYIYLMFTFGVSQISGFSKLVKYHSNPELWLPATVSMLSHSQVILHSVCLQYEQSKGWGSSDYWFSRLLLKTILRPRKAIHTQLLQLLLCFSLAPRSVGVTKPFWNLTLVHMLPSPL